MNEEELSGSEVLTKFLDQEEIFNFEGQRAIENLTKLFENLDSEDYKEQPFRYGSPIESFLQDNSGACQAIIEWIEKQMDRGCDHWKDNLSKQLIEDEDEDEE